VRIDRETLTGGEELLHKPEGSRDMTRPARAKTELVLISVQRYGRVVVCNATWTHERTDVLQALIYFFSDNDADLTWSANQGIGLEVIRLLAVIAEADAGQGR
jgi:hypothetical protein